MPAAQTRTAVRARGKAKRQQIGKLTPWKPAFLAALEKCGTILKACELAGVGRTTVHDARRRDPQFAEQFQASLEIAGWALEAEATRRAKDGVERLVFYQGKPVIDPRTGQPYVEHAYSDQLLIALLKRHFPNEYRERIDTRHGGAIATGPLTAEEMAEIREELQLL